MNRSISFDASRRNSGWLVTGIYIIALNFSPAYAHSGAEGIVKERMDMMDKIGKNMKAMKGMIQGKTELSPDKIVSNAESIQSASKHIKKMFPEGSINGPSEALPTIWENWQKFSSLTEELSIESENLKQLSTSQDKRSLMKQFAKVGKICRSCHTDFRKKKSKKE